MGMGGVGMEENACCYFEFLDLVDEVELYESSRDEWVREIWGWREMFWFLDTVDKVELHESSRSWLE
jgi:hypothetical protein